MKYEIEFVRRQGAQGRTRIIPVILNGAGPGDLPVGCNRFHAVDGRGKRGAEIAGAVMAELKRPKPATVSAQA